MSNPTPSLPVMVGLLGNTPVIADLGSGLHPEGAVSVVLTADYTLLRPPGYPSRPAFTGTATPDYPHTVSNGATLACFNRKPPPW